MKQFLTYIFLLIATFVCHSQASLNKKEKEIITQEIKIMLNNYHNDIVKDGIEDELMYLDTSSDFFWVPPGYNSPLNYESIKDILLSNSKAINYIEFSWETIKIFPLTKKIASYSGIAKCVEVGDNLTSMTFRIIESGTLIKRGDDWKFLNGQSRLLDKN